ncbi:MAG: cadherin-like domain-containing protein, partial [Candidatus Latescibacteria bacterium]|nr:cadherin-like domain-containing protein [Candidatus Latescibacterota bacterium]
NGDILAGDGDTIYRIDPVTGNRTIITSDDGDPGGQIVGTGADIALVSDLMVEADGNIVVLDGVNQILIRVDVVTGDRTFLQQGQGTGPLITLSQSALQLPSGPIVVMNIIDKSILHFDPVTHDRTLISDNSTGIGTLFVLPIYLALEPPLNAPPLADDDAAITDEGFPITISVLDNDIDPEESALSIIGVTQGVNGTVQIEDGDQTVTYAPDPGFSGTDTFTYIVSDGAKSSTATVSVTVNFISRLRFENAYVVPGTPATVAVSLDVSVPVSEVSFDIQPQLNSTATTVVQFGSGLNHVEPLGFDLATSIGQDGLVTVTLNTSSGATIPVGETTILVLLFDSNENTPVATDLDLVITAVLLEDSNSAPILQEADSGQIRFGQPGDPTLDGVFNILDIGRVVRHILQILPPPLDFDLFLADANSDEMLDIRDAITVVNLFLFGEPVPPAKLTSGNTVRMAEVGLADARKVDEGYLLPITLNSNGSVSGMQVALTVEGPDVTIGSPMLADNAAGLFLDYNILDDVVNLVLMGQSGERFLPGSGAVILVPIVAQPSLYPNITLKDALLSDMYAMEIPVQISNRSAAIEPDPGGFQLISASPNPFNPTTSIAYAVEEESQISLTVYNLLGQEVVRLVNRAHAPGRYSVEWDGRNERGVSVGSGVYIYRLVSSAGFAASRRMTLLK